MNEQNEINGDLRDEWQAIQEAEALEREEAMLGSPEVEFDDWLSEVEEMGGEPTVDDSELYGDPSCW
jgi:hypothetical protein